MIYEVVDVAFFAISQNTGVVFDVDLREVAGFKYKNFFELFFIFYLPGFATNMMLKMKYPGYDAHHKEHLKFIRMVKESRNQLKTGVDQEQLLDKVLSFLKNWLLHHILVEDRKYYEHLTT